MMAKEILVDPAKCLGCGSCELACAVARGTTAKTLAGAYLAGEEIRPAVAVLPAGGEALPVQCRHCREAPCLDACPAGALRRDGVTQTVLLEPDRCLACYMCVMVCPFGAIHPSRGGRGVMKCDRCHERDEPACVNACPTGALQYGEILETAARMTAERAPAVREALRPGEKEI